MSTLGDYLHDAGWYLGEARARVSNAVYRATRPYRSAAGNRRNARNRRAVARGRRPLSERAGSRITARTPLYRSRINRATGRPHRDDAATGRLTDQSLARLRDAHAQRMMPGPARSPGRGHRAARQPEAWEHGPDAARSVPQRAPREHADAVFGPGAAARAEEALRQANVNPWAERPGRSR